MLQLVRTRQIELALSVPVYMEYQDVLHREKSLTALGLAKTDVDAFLRLAAYLGKPHDIFYLWRPNLRDEADNMLLELAVASRSQWLITNNVRDFSVGNELRHDGLLIGTPAQFVRQWRQENE
ncbi:MAG: PIN domain-containing protein [Ardenticatenaceae bacterium]|nr:PIN domain-containing protein [Ardenticatenaceae bacterium]